MENFIKFLSLILFIICFFTSNAECIDKNRREEWPVVKNAIAIIGGKKVEVYHDPKNFSHIFIYQECWLIRRDTKMVVMPNCTFEMEGETLYFEKTWRDPKGHVPGVEWGDPKIDSISYLSTIFRKPKFRETSVSFWDGSKWIHIEGLPVINKE